MTVEKPEQGFMCTLSMFARVPFPPDQLYELLVDSQQCLRIFKTLKVSPLHFTATQSRSNCALGNDAAVVHSSQQASQPACTHNTQSPMLFPGPPFLCACSA